MKKIKQDLQPVETHKVPAILEQFLKEFNFATYVETEKPNLKVRLTKQWQNLELLLGREFKNRSNVVMALNNNMIKYKVILKKYPYGNANFAPDRNTETLKINTSTYKVLFKELGDL